MKKETKKKIINAVIVIIVVIALFGAADFLVNNFDIVGLLKKLHGG